MISFLASLGSPESVKPSYVPDQSDVLNLESAEGERAEDSSTSTVPTKGLFCFKEFCT